MSKKLKSFYRVVFITIFCCLISNNVAAVQYACPKIPFDAKIGDIVEKNWIVSFNPYMEIIYMKKLYFKYKGESYTFSSWYATYHMKRDKEYEVGCCSRISASPNVLCVMRILKYEKCKSILDNDDEKFVCETKL